MPEKFFSRHGGGDGGVGGGGGGRWRWPVAVVVEIDNVAAGTRAWVTSGRGACRMDEADAVQVGAHGRDAQAYWFLVCLDIYIYMYNVSGKHARAFVERTWPKRMRYHMKASDSHGEELHFSGWPGGGRGCWEECSWIVQYESFSEGSFSWMLVFASVVSVIGHFALLSFGVISSSRFACFFFSFLIFCFVLFSSYFDVLVAFCVFSPFRVFFFCVCVVVCVFFCFVVSFSLYSIMCIVLCVWTI